MPKESFTQNFVKIGLDLAEILRISKLRLAWRRREGEKGRRRRRGGILLCNVTIIMACGLRQIGPTIFGEQYAV